MNTASATMAAAVIHPHSSLSRGLPTNPAQGIRRIPLPTFSMPPPPPPPIPEKYNVPSAAFGAKLSASAPMSSAQVINLAREAMKAALQDNESQAAEASGVSNDLKPGVTIDLSRQNIEYLPDEVVDIIKNELERLALSHNKLTSFPVRFSECTSLRYLNVRNNHIKEFPLALCDLKSLEILDLGRNKIRILPTEIARLTSLKVLAVQKNLIEELPLCLADMGSLQVLKLDGNNIIFPPKKELQVEASSPPNQGFLKEREVAEVTVTAHIKKFLREHAQKSLNERKNMAEHSGGALGEDIETPRMPVKRVTSGRFPIRVNGNDVLDLRSPAIPRPPPIPSRSHARGLSQQSTAIRRPSVMPLTIGNPNERLRSNSETVLQTGRPERPSERNRRMGIMSRKPSELGTLDEGQANNRFSHYRGLSHGSSMTGNPNSNVSTASPSSPAEPLLQRPNYVRRLSVLPEQRRESRVFDPILESAKGILHAIFTIHPMIQLFTRLTSDGTAKRSSLEIVFYNTNVHVEELEQEILKHEAALDSGGHALRENENVQRAVLTLINAYSHVCSILVENMDTIVDNGDPRYVRNLMLLFYNSVMELRATYEASRGTTGYVPSYSARWPGLDNTIKPHSRENSVTPTIGRPGLGTRPRVGTFIHNPSNLRVATDASLPYFNGNNRTAQIMAATPRSGESFASSSTDPRFPIDFPAEERQFEKIFLSLQKSTDLLMRTLPNLNVQFSNGKRSAEIQRSPDIVIHGWRALIVKCGIAIRETEMLKNRLSMIKLKEPGIRTDAIFWSLCKSFIDSWAEFGNKLKQTMDQVSLSVDVKSRLRPIQISIKETSSLIMASPWGNLLRQAGHYSDTSSHYSPSHYSSSSTSTQMQLPMTPQSAALGPAVQATVPSTPQSGSFANVFSGNVFERADALISMGGLNMSRTNTMNSTSTMSLNSISSITSAGDERQGSSTMLSPNGTTSTATYRLNGGNKPAF
ncbi:RAM signaling pathway protein [Xylariaceae sp. AK1471]|nr:RAM signaling pathway protein [Xylariaceae sp. AK1471]